MTAKESDKKALRDELVSLKGQGIRIMYEGKEVEADEPFVNMLLGDSGCTYMRNYVFKNSKVVEVEFGRIVL